MYISFIPFAKIRLSERKIKLCLGFSEREYLRPNGQSTIKREICQIYLSKSELNEQREEKSNVFELSRVVREEDR